MRNSNPAADLAESGLKKKKVDTIFHTYGSKQVVIIYLPTTTYLATISPYVPTFLPTYSYATYILPVSKVSIGIQDLLNNTWE